MGKCFDRWKSHFDQRFEDAEKNKASQRLVGLHHEAQHPRLATEADVETDTKTCKRTEGAAADGDKYGDTSCARDEDGPTSMTSFGNIVESPAPGKCVGKALVNEGAEAPKAYLPRKEVRVLSSAAGGSLLASTTSTTMRTIFPPPPLSWSLLIAKRSRRQAIVRQPAGQTSTSVALSVGGRP